jgi:hypothetical protein
MAAQTMEYRATMELCSGKFLVDIANALSARPCCTYIDHVTHFST